MKRTLLSVGVLAAGSCLAIAAAVTPKGSVCRPLHFAGITVGINDDVQVQRLLGRGVFRADEGHTGGRYFLDAGGTATLHVVEGVDKVVDELTVRSGIDPGIKPGERASAVSRWFDPQEGFGNWHELHLGSSRDAVLANLGEPQRRVNTEKWVYESTCACELSAYLTLSFKSGRVVEISMAEEE